MRHFSTEELDAPLGQILELAKQGRSCIERMIPLNTVDCLSLTLHDSAHAHGAAHQNRVRRGRVRTYPSRAVSGTYNRVTVGDLPLTPGDLELFLPEASCLIAVSS